ncbi:AMP-binding protein [Rhodococcus jostii]|uniref:Crotonobetaine/carnitine-CoA ligase n=1 Tax=Rhodococcus jostii TaxID=132919 RepID=A0A1H5M0X3_RHOJO|nr:AMP-binding protein [Rhodococcus jostii]SEE82870.1 crotonobetaine/carnitine-CoA ligase [Rhodococcus jostii]
MTTDTIRTSDGADLVQPGLLPELRDRTVDNLWQRAVRSNPQGTFLLWETSEFTYAEADVEVAKTTRMLRDAGVTPGTHVAVLLDNRPEYIWLLLAIGRIGAVGVPIHAEAKGQLLGHFLRSTDCSYGVIASSQTANVESVLGEDRLGYVWILDDVPAGEIGTVPRLGRVQEPYAPKDVADGGKDDEHRVPRFSDNYLLMFTSGTSGPSKAAVVSQAQPITHALKIAESCGWNAQERFYTCLPLSHANAQCHTLLPAIGLGATVVLGRRFSVRKFWSDVQRFDCTAVSLLGSMLQLLWKKAPSPEESDNRVSTVLVVPFPRNVQEFDDRYQARFATLYGLTECAPVSISRPGEGYDRPAGMAGRILRDHNDVRIVDADDIEVPLGTVGEIAVRRHDPYITVQRYYGRERETWDDFRNLWFHTGDFGYVDEDDYLYFAGRKSDSLRRRGENVSIRELEEVLQSFTGVLEAAVIAVPSDLGDMSEDDIAVYFTSEDGAQLTAEQLDLLAEAELSRYMRPRYIRHVDDLPKTPTSKIRKDVLRRDAEVNLTQFFDAETRRQI